MICLNQKGQGFSVFRLLISAIMGLMILLIILGVVQYFDDIRTGIGMQQLVKAFNNSVNKPDGTVMKALNTELPAGTLVAAISLAQGSGVDSECITITGTGSGASNITYNPGIEEPGNNAQIERDVTVNVYIQCEKFGCQNNSENNPCETCCIVSLGKKLEPSP